MREKKRQKLEQNNHLIRRFSTKEIMRNEKFMGSYNPYRVIVHIHVFIDDSALFLRTWCDALIIENM
ncbi:hypothetical protein CFP56_012619 [Quercus suber]|uniref:Uncharacterized protein n=1 Tax=Quercus suber TaxID=58331 RepID=A0AAW0KVZ2_QUESU